MKKLLLLIGLVSLSSLSFGYDSRVAIKDTIPDTTQMRESTGANASVLSIATGLGSIGFGVFSLVQMANGNFEDVPAVFALVGVIGLLAVISGIIGLSKNYKLRQTQRTKAELEAMRKTKRQSIGGIVLGVIGIVFSIILIQMDYGNIGW